MWPCVPFDIATQHTNMVGVGAGLYEHNTIKTKCGEYPGILREILSIPHATLSWI